MKKWILGSIALALLAHQSPALASDEEVKCSKDAAVCASEMAAVLKERGWMGINFDYNEEVGHVVLDKVFENSPAEAAGLQAGDVLLSLNGIAYTDENKEALEQAYKEMRPGRTMTYELQREGRRLEIVVTVGDIPEYIVAQWVGKHMLHYHPSAETADKVDKD